MGCGEEVHLLVTLIEGIHEKGVFTLQQVGDPISMNICY
jgi:hypothetical protein